jgi:hypothetical protein
VIDPQRSPTRARIAIGALLVLALVGGITAMIMAPGRPFAARRVGPPPAPAVRIDLGAIESVEVTYHHSGWAVVDRRIRIDRGGEGWEAGGATVDPRAMRALAEAFDDLVPSDARKSCWDHTDDYPRIDVTIRGSAASVEASTRSNCSDFAPWNVVANGRLLVQASGRIGAALWPLLHALRDDIRGTAHERSPEFDWFDRRDLPDGGSLAPSFAEEGLRRARASALVADALGGAPVLGVTAYCNTEGNPTCRRLSGRIRVALADPFALEVDAELEDLEVTHVGSFPARDPRRLASSKLYAALVASSTTRPLALRWSDEKDCSQVARSAKDLGLEKPRDCGYWFTGAAASDGAPPAISFMSSLDLAWVRSGLGGEAERRFWRALGVADAAAIEHEGPRRRYVKLDGTMIAPK